MRVPLVVCIIRHPWRRTAGWLAAIVLASALSACGGGGEVGLVSGGAPRPDAASVDAQVALAPDDPAVATAPPESQPPATTTATTPATTASTIARSTPPSTVRPPVPLPADPAALVLSVSIEGGFPLWSRPRVQPIQLHAGGRLVRPERASTSSSAYRRLLVSHLPVAEVQALLAQAEDAGATSPPADLGRDPRIADAGVMIIEVDRPGLRSKLVVPDPVDSASAAPNLTPDQQARRRIALDLHQRLTTMPLPSTHSEAYVELVAYNPPPRQGVTTITATPSDLRPWPGAALDVGPYPRCFVLPFTELERRVPGWSASTTATRWQSGAERLQIDFYDATAKQGCGPPPG